jgi:soluble lytic murein transglycosylase
LLAIIVALASAYGFNRYWQHRFDPLIARHANFYNLDPDLVWSVIYEETYFRPWMHGDAEEVGLMQVTPTVAREWAGQTGLPELARRTERRPCGCFTRPRAQHTNRLLVSGANRETLPRRSRRARQDARRL